MKIQILGKMEDKPKMEGVANLLRQAAVKVNVPVEITHTHNFSAFSQFAVNPAKTPIVFIDGHLEFAGVETQLPTIIHKLTQIRAGGGQSF